MAVRRGRTGPMLTSRVTESSARSATVIDERLHSLASPLEGPYSGQKLGKVERLDQVVVCAPVQPRHPVAGRVACGQHQDGKSRPPTTKSLDDLEPVTLGIRQSRMATSYS